MLKRTIITAVCIILMLLLPLLSAGNGISGSGRRAPEQEKEQISSSGADDKKPQDENEDECFIIKDRDSGRLIRVNDRDFCIGALAYEMSPGFEHEALCAQAVALYSHFCFLRDAARAKEAEYDIECGEGETFIDAAALQKRFGSGYEEGMKKYKAAVDEVFGLILTGDDGSLIDAAYFAMSSGRTEDARDVFGKEFPCLTAVPSPWDMLEADHISTITVTAKELAEKLPQAKRNADGSIEIGEFSRTSSGTVIEAELGGTAYTGAQLRSLFALRSACFELKEEGEDYIFTVRGYGHGVGMSQRGADSMAKQGAAWKEIVAHYYPGSHIKTRR